MLLFRNLLSGAYKDNTHLHKGVLTGILHVTKESIFSGLNNLSVHTLLSPKFSRRFGFTPDEVAQLAQESGLADAMSEIERWYNGYRFGGQTIYNPWSVLSYLSNPEAGFKPYWINTASDALLRELLVERGSLAGANLESLLAGDAVTVTIDEHIALRDLRAEPDTVWSLLLFSGYLCAEEACGVDAEGRPRWRLRVPNREVRLVCTGLFGRFLWQGLGRAARVTELCEALLGGDADTFGELLEGLLLTTVSYHDVAVRRPEAVYQAFLLGLLVRLEARTGCGATERRGEGGTTSWSRREKLGRPARCWN